MLFAKVLVCGHIRSKDHVEAVLYDEFRLLFNAPPHNLILLQHIRGIFKVHHRIFRKSGTRAYPNAVVLNHARRLLVHQLRMLQTHNAGTDRPLH